MVHIRAIDMLHLDDLFEMHGGYVLNFSDRTFAQFFAELDIDIDHPNHAHNGRSKAKRLRTFLTTADKRLIIRALNALWEYRETVRQRADKEETVKNAYGRLLDIINRINGDKPQDQHTPTPGFAFDRVKIAGLRSDLLALSGLEPQPRGYAFEKFLKQLFDAYGLQAREPFRLRGEQIDGSFVLDKEVYLLEAKWQSGQSDISQLHAFQGKVEQKAAWTRGLFLSHAGFSDDGLHAFGRGKRVVCMDGLDLYDALDREIPLNHVLERKVRRAGETGMAFVRVRDLFT